MCLRLFSSYVQLFGDCNPGKESDDLLPRAQERALLLMEVSDKSLLVFPRHEYFLISHLQADELTWESRMRRPSLSVYVC